MRKNFGEHADKSEAVYQKATIISISPYQGMGAIWLKTGKITPVAGYSSLFEAGMNRK